MSYDIAQLHIADDTPEAQAIATIVSRDHVSPEEAVRRCLRRMAVAGTTPADEMWGALSSPEDSAILDEAMRLAHQRRKLDQPQPNIGASYFE